MRLDSRGVVARYRLAVVDSLLVTGPDQVAKNRHYSHYDRAQHGHHFVDVTHRYLRQGRSTYAENYSTLLTC